ncbi:hypothetical protein [Alicyclobacillus fodiniaquatilis]|uniref:Uncharacterized protein n=1 Tax=Alicyclobacillus fodiniaquatilis TaxID=1661150 RepID=A0ABW4JJN4_9BACL
MQWLNEIEGRLKWAHRAREWEHTYISDEEQHITVDYTYENGIHRADWIAQIETEDKCQGEAAGNAQFIAWAGNDIDKLIQAVLVAEKALREAHDHLSKEYNSMYVWSITGQALARLQFGKFGDGDTN